MIFHISAGTYEIYPHVYMKKKQEVWIPRFDNHRNPNELDHYILNGNHQGKQPTKRIPLFFTRKKTYLTLIASINCEKKREHYLARNTP